MSGLTWVEGAAGPLGLVPLLLPPRAPAPRPRQPLLDGRVPGVRPGLLHARPRVPLVPRGAAEHAALLPPAPLCRSFSAGVVVVVDVVEVDAESAGRRRAVVRLVSGSGPSGRVSREHQHYFTEASQLLHEDRDLSASVDFYSFTIRVLLSLSRSAVFTCTSELEPTLETWTESVARGHVKT